MKLVPLTAPEYVRSVLPHSAQVWAGNRSFPEYVSDFEALSALTYCRNRFLYGVKEGNDVVASLRVYDREIHWGRRSLTACGIGSVFTRPDARGRGYATAMIATLLDAERAAGRDVAYLFSDIHPHFYERLGFLSLPSRAITLRAASLDCGYAGGVPLEESDWTAIRRCFDKLEMRRPWGFRRTPLVWEWMRFQFMRAGSTVRHLQPVQLVVRRGASVIAYLAGRRVLDTDAFVIDDFAYATDEGRVTMQRLIRAAAGDLARVKGWLPPSSARGALPGGSVRLRKDALFLVIPLSNVARGWWKAEGNAARESSSDPVWNGDHV